VAINTTDRDALVIALMEMFGEDYVSIAKVIARLEIRFSTVTWRARLTTLALSYQPYIDSGLSIPWFTTEVGRLADAYKG
jgi:hypothetical protein